jgi:hypothetical protein
MLARHVLVNTSSSTFDIGHHPSAVDFRRHETALADPLIPKAAPAAIIEFRNTPINFSPDSQSTPRG